MSRPSCSTLLIGWVLLVVMILLVEWLGDAGLIAALIPMGIAHRMRGQHDRAMMERVLASPLGRKLFIFYYIPFLGSVVIYCAIHRINLASLPVFLFLLLLAFPILVAMAINDLKTCLGSNQDKSD